MFGCLTDFFRDVSHSLKKKEKKEMYINDIFHRTVDTFVSEDADSTPSNSKPNFNKKKVCTLDEVQECNVKNKSRIGGGLGKKINRKGSGKHEIMDGSESSDLKEVSVDSDLSGQSKSPISFINALSCKNKKDVDCSESEESRLKFKKNNKNKICNLDQVSDESKESIDSDKFIGTSKSNRLDHNSIESSNFRSISSDSYTDSISDRIFNKKNSGSKQKSSKSEKKEKYIISDSESCSFDSDSSRINQKGIFYKESKEEMINNNSDGIENIITLKAKKERDSIIDNIGSSATNCKKLDSTKKSLMSEKHNSLRKKQDNSNKKKPKSSDNEIEIKKLEKKRTSETKKMNKEKEDYSSSSIRMKIDELEIKGNNDKRNIYKKSMQKNDEQKNFRNIGKKNVDNLDSLIDFYIEDNNNDIKDKNGLSLSEQIDVNKEIFKKMQEYLTVEIKKL